MTKPRSSMWSVRISRWLYSALVATYPAEIRHEYGSEMMEAFGNRCAEESQRGGISGFVFFLL